MPLSISKLTKLLEDKNFSVKRYYKLYGTCAFVEMISNISSTTFMMYIQSKYEFKINEPNTYKLKYISLSDSDKEEVSDEYAGSPQEDMLEKAYQNISLNHNYGKKNENFENKLEISYKKSITIKDLESTDSYDVKCIFRQLRRLKYCVSDLRYKLVILYKRYLCVLHRDDSIDCFYIKKFPISDEPRRELIITFDLELLYENSDNIMIDLEQIKEGIDKIFDKNHLAHAKNLQYMLEKRSDLVTVSNNIFIKKTKLRNEINKHQILLKRILQEEKVIYSKLSNLQEKNVNRNNITRDISYIHQKNQYIKELEKLCELKDSIMENILMNQAKEKHTTLMVDKILFDNMVMLDRIFKNIQELYKMN